jgi:hypothetical protein
MMMVEVRIRRDAHLVPNSFNIQGMGFAIEIDVSYDSAWKKLLEKSAALLEF